MAVDPSSVFRQRAIDRLSSPEQLDRLMVVARPRDWLGLGTLAALVVLALGWSIIGSISTRVTGRGILVSQSGQIFSAVSSAEGDVVRMRVTEGQQVRAGDILLEIAQPAIVQQLQNAEANAAELRGQLVQLRGQVSDYAGARSENAAAQRRAVVESRNNAASRADEADRQLRASETLRSRGFITERAITQLRQEAASARQAVAEASSRLIDIDAQQIGARNTDSRDIRSAAARLADAERQVADLRLRMRLSEQVRSPATGRVTEIKAPVGAHVPAGAQLVSIETGQAGLQLVLFLPPDQGKAVRPGMTVQVSPSVVKKEEFGTIRGVVRQVSEFPSTQEAMRGLLQNDQLVTSFSEGGAPFAARIDLVRDASTASGYSWAGGGGPPTTLSSGTLATGEVTVRKRAPISYAIPLLRQSTGL